MSNNSLDWSTGGKKVLILNKEWLIILSITELEHIPEGVKRYIVYNDLCSAAWVVQDDPNKNI